MAIRTIRTEGDEILRKKSKKVEVIDEKIRELIQDMKETLHKYDGVGLAAVQVGIPPENIFIMNNGRVMELTENSAKMTGVVQSGKILVDGLGIGDVGNIVLRDRQHLSQDGLIVVVLTMDSATGEVVSGPDIISRGFVYVKESENIMDEVKRTVQRELYKCEEKGIKDWSSIKSNLKDGLRDYVFAKTKRNPMILPIIMEV